MFEYFEDNYTWNMAVNLALGMGGNIGDIDDASRALRPLARRATMPQRKNSSRIGPRSAPSSSGKRQRTKRAGDC